MQETAKRAKERPQIWNARKERKERAKGTAKGADDFLIKKRRNGMQVNKARRASMLQVRTK